MWAIAFTQVVLAVALVGLVVDRTTGWMTPVRPPLPVTQAEAHSTVPLAEVAKLEQQLVELSRMHAKAVETIQAQQQGMAQLQRTMTKLSSAQETVASSVLGVKQKVEQRQKGVGRDADRMTRVIMNQAKSVQEQMEAEIHSLTVANDRLSNELFRLDQNNRERREQMISADVDVSKATPPTSREADGGQ
jgi:chromosome segregation ATPase